MAKSDCIAWQGYYSRYGYGVFTTQGKVKQAHRLAWMVHYGDIPPGMQVCHRCDNRKCVNIDHLFLGTAADNQHDKTRKGRQAKGIQNGRAKLSEAQVMQIRESSDTYAALRERFGVSTGLIHAIKHRKLWSHL